MLLRPILQAVRNPNSPSLSGSASELGDPLEQAAYLRGRMKAQEYLQKNQVSEANQNRLLAAQDENERRNAAREAMAEQRFGQAQKMDAERMARQDEIQAQNLAHQQFLEKFNMQKALTDQERFNTTEARAQAAADAAAKKEADKQAAAELKAEAEAAVTSAIGDTKVPDRVFKGLVSTYIATHPEARATFDESFKGLREHAKAMTKYEALKTSLDTSVNVGKKGEWFTPGSDWPHPFDTAVNVVKGYTPDGMAIIATVRQSEAKANKWPEVTKGYDGQWMIGDKPVEPPAEPTMPTPKFGGLISSDTMPKVPAGTSPMAPPPAAAPVVAPPAAVAAPVAPTPTQYTEAEFRAEMQRRRPDVPIEAAVATARQRGIIR